MISTTNNDVLTISARWRIARAAIVSAALLSITVWTTRAEACDLAIILDQTASMQQLRASTGRTRCEDSVYYAEDIVNYYRCGAATCPNGTLDQLATDFQIDGTIGPGQNDTTYGFPSDNCATAATKRLNVFIFNSGTGTTGSPLQSITKPIAGSDSEGWITFSLSDQNSTGQAVLNAIDQQKDACANVTPLADAVCQMQIPTPLGNQSLLFKKLKILTDSGENDSSGACAGGETTIATPPFSGGSWEGNVYSTIVAAHGWNVDSTIFQPAGSILSSNVVLRPNGTTGSNDVAGAAAVVNRIDPETKQAMTVMAASTSSLPADVELFVALSNVTYGNSSVVSDNTPISPIIGPQASHPAPAAPPWGIFGLSLILGITGFIVVGHQRVRV